VVKNGCWVRTLTNKIDLRWQHGAPKQSKDIR
jgi:hypothetical protein